MQIVGDFSVLLLAAGVLILEDIRGRTRVTCVEENQVVLEIGESLRTKLEGTDGHRIVPMKFKASYSAEGSYVLVLLADGLSQSLNFDVTSLLSQVLLGNDGLLVKVQCLEQRREKTSA